MARYTGPRVRISRRIGFNVFENKNSQDKISIQDPQRNKKEKNLDLNSEIQKIFKKI